MSAIEAAVEGKRYPYQLVSGAMGELLIPGESRDSRIAIQIPKDSQNVAFDIADLRTNNLQRRVPLDLQE